MRSQGEDAYFTVDEGGRYKCGNKKEQHQKEAAITRAWVDEKWAQECVTRGLKLPYYNSHPEKIRFCCEVALHT